MKHLTRKLLGKGGMALVVFSLVIGFIAGTNTIQPHPVAKASVSRVSNQQPDRDQGDGDTHGSMPTATPLPSPTIGSMDQGVLPHSENDPHQSASGHHHMPMPSDATQPGLDSGHGESNTAMGISPDTRTRTIVLGSFATFNGSMLVIAAFLKRRLPQRKRVLARGKTNQNSSEKGNIV